MPVTRLLQNTAFDPETIRVISDVFEKALIDLGLTDRTDPLAELLAKKIIEAAQTGERDPLRIYQRAIDSLSATTPGYPGWPAARDDDSKSPH
jgi:hypothetical protein